MCNCITHCCRWVWIGVSSRVIFPLTTTEKSSFFPFFWCFRSGYNAFKNAKKLNDMNMLKITRQKCYISHCYKPFWNWMVSGYNICVCIVFGYHIVDFSYPFFQKKRLEKTKTIASAYRVQSIFDLFDVFLNQLSTAQKPNSVCWCFDVFYTKLYSKKRKKIKHSVFRAFCRHPIYPCMRMALE